jgi:hypothetical protein
MSRIFTEDDIVTTDPATAADDVTACLLVLRHARARHQRCPSGENAAAVEEAQERLGYAEDRLPRCAVAGDCE